MKFVTLVFNAKNPVGLGTNTKGTAEEVWELFKAGYEVTSNMARLLGHTLHTRRRH